MKYARIIGVVVTLGVIALALVSVVANAQDSAELRCNADEISAQLQWAIDTLTAAQDGTLAEQYQAMINVRIALVALDEECLNLADTATSLSLQPTPNLTATAIEWFFRTQEAITPTPNMTQTLAPCVFDYIVVQPEEYDQPPAPWDFDNPRLVMANETFEFDLVFANTGNCVWPSTVRLAFNADLTQYPDDWINLDPLQEVCEPYEIRPGLNFAVQQRQNFFIKGKTHTMEESSPLTFTGEAPSEYGCYYSAWDMLYPNSAMEIGRPLVLTIRVR